MEIMEKFTFAKEIIQLIISTMTIFLVWLGLKTWKVQLKGENKFQLSLEVLRELKVLLYKINDYRNPFYSAGEIIEAFYRNNSNKEEIFDPLNKDLNNKAKNYAEFERWKIVIDQYLVYEDKMLRLMVLMDDYNFDKINNKNFKKFILELRHERFKHDTLNEEKEYRNSLNEEAKQKLKKEIENNRKILFKYSDKDEWGFQLEEYFLLLNMKLRKFIK